MSDYDWVQYIREQQSHRLSVRKSFQVSKERLDLIRNYEKTRRIMYPEYKEAFDYVHDIYPSVGVKQAFVYLTSKALLQNVGYTGLGGFYDNNAKVVCVTNCIREERDDLGVYAEITIDEVLCHELIHYAANSRLPMSSRDIEEEIAYGKSVGYLRLRGHTDDFIINKNMLPYLISVVDKGDVIKKVLIKHYGETNLLGISNATVDELIRPLKTEIRKQTIEAAQELGRRMISVYGGGKKKEHRLTHKQLIIEDFI